VFTKLLVANRGEIAVRIIQACHEMGIAAVAVYSEADVNALHTQLADEAVLIGPASPAESYLHSERILAAAQRTDCQAIHPGYGFLSENANFAQAVQDAGLTFVGPHATAIRSMGSKTSARTTMQAIGVPVTPGYQASDDDDELLAAAHSIGAPLLVKAAAGGGGKGMRSVYDLAELPAALQSARREAQNAFGDSRVYLEKLISEPHHVEFQILGDQYGNLLHLFERECSIQRRHQKIIEETPSPLLDESLRQRMGEAAVRAAQAVAYSNAGTVEFLVDAERNFYFLEMNTRLQVEHPITELATGLDLVQWQLRIAAGEALSFRQEQISQRGHAMECRIYAEDPAHDFLPAVGKVFQLIAPYAPGVRVDCGVRSGDKVTLHYDPMIAKLSVLGETRQAAIAKLDWALRHFVIQGDVITNIDFLRAVLAHPAFVSGDTPTDFIARHLAAWRPAESEAAPDWAVAIAALAEMATTSTQSATSAADHVSEADSYSPWAARRGFRIH
jgi:acetyl-CoA carboxylase biotin carboxylase subunit